MSGGFGNPFPLDFSNAQDIGTVAGTPPYSTSLTSGGSANALGAWTTLIASTSFDAAWIDVDAINQGTGQDMISISLAVGAAAAEQAIISDLVIGSSSTNGLTARYNFPVSIPAGTRISAAVRSAAASDHGGIRITLRDSAFQVIDCSGVVDTYGFNQSTTKGTAVTPNASANTKGSYSQLVASTTNDMIGFIFAMDNQNAVPSAGNWLLDVAIGVGGSELIIEPNFPFITESGWFAPRCSLPIWVSIPAGTRLAARAQSSNAADNAIGLTIYGIRA